MGDRADELVFHLLGLFQPLGHLVDGTAQPVYLVPLVAGHGQADIQLPPGDGGGRPFHLAQRHHDAPHKVQARHHRKHQDRQHDDPTDGNGILELPCHQRHTGHQPHGRHVLRRVGHQIADGHDLFPALGLVEGHPHAVHSILCLLKIALGHDAVSVRAAGGRNDAAVAVQQHELVFVLIGKLLHHPAESHTAAGGSFLGRVARIHLELSRDGRKPPHHGLLHAVVVAAGVAVEEHSLHQHQQQHRQQQVAPQPPASDPASHWHFPPFQFATLDCRAWHFTF